MNFETKNDILHWENILTSKFQLHPDLLISSHHRVHIAQALEKDLPWKMKDSRVLEILQAVCSREIYVFLVL